MTPKLIDAVASAVARETGIPTAARAKSNTVLSLEPREAPKTAAFSIDVSTGWRNATAQFVPGRFAKRFVRLLGHAPEEARLSFLALASTHRPRIRLSIKVNGAAFQPSSHWPADWSEFSMIVRRERIVPEELSPPELQEILCSIAIPAFSMVVALAGFDGLDVDDSALEGGSEEAQSRRYERKPINRIICLSLKGHRCWCCGLNFSDQYGPGAEGFIEVHHRIPLAGLGPHYRLHPVRDLFPVCSNCHSVLHLAKPPEDPESLRIRLGQR